MMRPNRLINILFLLLLSACSNPLPPEIKPTLTPGVPTGQTSAQLPATVAVSSLTALPRLTPTVETLSPALTPTATATPALLNLTQGLSGNPLSPSWSPDGRYIVFSLDDPGQPNHNQLYKAATDGSGSTKLVDHPGASDFLPQWSPDGSQILFCSAAADGSGTNVFVVSADGASLTQLTHDHASLCQAVWSPDSSQIALISDREGNQSGRLYVMKADGTDLHLAADVNNSVNPVWSPDGRTLLFSSLDGSGAGMYSTSADGHGFIQLIKNPAFEAGMQWSPDGNKIIYQAGSNLYMINPDSSGQAQVLPQQTGMGGEAWSPDGSWIAFHANPAGDFADFRGHHGWRHIALLRPSWPARPFPTLVTEWQETAFLFAPRPHGRWSAPVDQL